MSDREKLIGELRQKLDHAWNATKFWPRDRAGIVNTSAVRDDLTLLLRRVAAGDIILIAKNGGPPLAALVPPQLLDRLADSLATPVSPPGGSPDNAPSSNAKAEGRALGQDTVRFGDAGSTPAGATVSPPSVGGSPKDTERLDWLEKKVEVEEYIVTFGPSTPEVRALIASRMRAPAVMLVDPRGVRGTIDAAMSPASLSTGNREE